MGRGTWGWIVVGAALVVLPPVAGRPASSAHAGGAPPDVTDVAGDAASVDLGLVAVGEEVRHAFRIANDSARPLTLRAQRVPAGIAVRAMDHTIPAGGSGRVELGIDGFAFAGPVTLDVVLATDDATRATIRLTLAVDVHAFVLADPGFARYLFVQGAPEGTIGQTISATDGAPFRVTRATSPLRDLRVAVREARLSERTEGAPPGRQWRIEATLASHPPVGPLGGFIELTLDHPRQHRLRIPVSGFVRPMLAVTPPAGELGDVRAGEPVQGRFVVKNFAEEGLVLEHVTSDVPGLTAVVKTTDPGHAFTIGLVVAIEARPGPFDGHLRIRTSSTRQRRIDVPIRGTIVEPSRAAAATSVP